MANQQKTMSDVHFPLKKWLNWEVLSYLKAQNIPIPESRADNASASLREREIMHLYRHHREDYERLRQFFPYIHVEVCAAEWFGQHAEDGQAKPRRGRRKVDDAEE
jgi:hypothetical protein